MNYNITITVNPMTFGKPSNVIRPSQFAAKATVSAPVSLAQTTQRFQTHRNLAASGYMTICNSLVPAGSAAAVNGQPYEALIPIPAGYDPVKTAKSMARNILVRHPGAKFSFKSKNVTPGYIRVIRFK